MCWAIPWMGPHQWPALPWQEDPFQAGCHAHPAALSGQNGLSFGGNMHACTCHGCGMHSETCSRGLLNFHGPSSGVLFNPQLLMLKGIT